MLGLGELHSWPKIEHQDKLALLLLVKDDPNLSWLGLVADFLDGELLQWSRSARPHFTSYTGGTTSWCCAET